MNIASITEIKRELQSQEKNELIDVLLKIARYKVENKEYLNYILFESANEPAFIENIKYQIDLFWNEINTSSLYYAKKTIRKILRFIKKQIKFSDKAETEVELLIYFCQKMLKSNIPFRQSRVLINLYNRQIEAIEKSLNKMHEDLRLDYLEEFNNLKNTFFDQK